MARNRLILLRHGESMGNVWKLAYGNDRTNFLSDMGVKQAEIAGIYLKRQGYQFEYIASSDLTRARQTTAMALIHMSDWQRTYDAIPELNECWDPDKDPKRASDDKSRVYVGMDMFMTRWTDGDALCVTHYHTMQNIFSYLNVPRQNIDSYAGKQVPNAVPFLYDANNPTKIVKLDPSLHGPQF